MSENTKRNIGIKGLIVGGLILLLILPTLMISNLVNERKARQEEAVEEVSSKWAGAQTISGPVLSIPYLEYFKDSSGSIHKTRKYIHILPDQLNINASFSPERRYRSIYEIVVYNSKISFSGNFINLTKPNPSVSRENILYDQAFVSIGITDLRGIKEQVSLKWNDHILSFNPGVESNDVLKSGINTLVKLDPKDSINKEYTFSVTLDLKGSQNLYFTPIGKVTQVSISSNWPTPKFDGAFLPEKREVSEKGFTASWKVLHLNRNYPQQWLNDQYSIETSAFGVNLFSPMDNYVKTDRSIKYAILFIALTFLIFFFLELLNNKSIHPLQYILIGFALCIFYILLLSVSEYLNYNLSYLIASFMTIGLITWYAKTILSEGKLASLVAGNLVILYGFIFTIIQLEDYALLMGSFGLFLILAIVMHFSRKINWQGIIKR